MILRWIAAAVVLLPAVQASTGPSRIACLSRKPSARWSLPPALREISGLALTDDGRLLVHGDESARIVQLDYRTGAIVKSFQMGKPAPRGDFEGMAVAGPRIVLVTSGGRLYESREGNDGESVPATITETNAGALCEIEGLAWEPKDRALLMLCKTPRRAELSHTVSMLRWSPDQRRWLTPDRISLPIDAALRKMIGREFRGSDLARDPVTGHYLAVAGLNQAVVELTPAGELIGAAPLGRHHPQAEGIAVARDGTVLVSDEGGKGPAHLTVYTCAR